PLGEALLAPTRIYVRPLLALYAAQEIHALAHITGGGLPENLPRVMPENTRARIDASAWPRPAVFDWLQQQGGISDEEMLRTFNCGIGMVVVLPEEGVDAAQTLLREQGIESFLIGRIEAGDGRPEVIVQ
ncbi:MAG: phosphoribosylformylglycinamidine cyclo-ligase, partial [Gammaproteobacteria bacterium]